MINKAGLDLIREFEGCRLTPYKDVAGLWTIGIGHLIKRNECFKVITQKEAEGMLQNDLRLAEADVDSCVKVPINENQRAALVSFTYNCGGGALRSSTLLRKINAGDMDGAENEFVRWNKAGGKVVDGLTRRRLAEAALFSKPIQGSRVAGETAGHSLISET